MVHRDIPKPSTVQILDVDTESMQLEGMPGFKRLATSAFLAVELDLLGQHFNTAARYATCVRRILDDTSDKSAG